MRNNTLIFVLTIVLLVVCTVIILTSGNYGPIEYFLWGLVGGLLLFYTLANIIHENRKQKSTDLLQRLQLLATDGVKAHGSGHSGSYTIGYNVAMHDVQQFVRREWRNLA